MFLVGLTGGIGCGKSTVSKMFDELGIPIIDSDFIARKVVEPGQKGHRRIREIFGSSVFLEDGHLNRKKMGQLIFGDAKKRAQLNSITHPEIAKEIIRCIAYYFIRGHQFVIIDSPLLYEVNTWLRFVHKVIVVSCDDEQQLQRLRERDNFSEDEAMSRIQSQMPMTEKRKRADYIIHNNETIPNTKEQVLGVHQELKSLKTHWILRLGLAAIFTVIASGYFMIWL